MLARKENAMEVRLADEAATGKATRGPAAPDSRLIRLPVRVEGGEVFYVYGE
jgi:hypothetical protein